MKPRPRVAGDAPPALPPIAIGWHAARGYSGCPGSTGPGRSVLDRVRTGRAHRVDLPDHVFSRVHVDDIASGVIAGLDAPEGVYNLADDLPCSQNALVEAACRLLALPVPPLQSLAEVELSAMARGFYSERRRIANGKAKRMLAWRPVYPTYREGLAALLRPDNAISSPASASAAPAPASTLQR